MALDEKSSDWFLEGFAGDQKTMRRWIIDPLPYVVGRHSDSNLCLPLKSVSNRHAEFYVGEDRLWIRDLNSTNGTFINRRKVSDAEILREGDVIHFSETEFRVGRVASRNEDISETVYTDLSETKLPELMAVGSREFKRMLLTHSIRPLFQPLVDLGTGVTMGYEVLGRGDQEGLATSPYELFRIASSLGLETELSRLFRAAGIEEARALPGAPKIFVNTHPSEMETPKLLSSLKRSCEESPGLGIVVEIHESAVTEPAAIKQLKAELQSLGIELAYDDFGAGQARLLELAEVPPDFLKFDIGLIRGIDQASPPMQKVVKSLVSVGNDIGVICLAEGIETEGEKACCIDLGFTLGQGYLLGKPAPAAIWKDQG